jgi:uncharacterized integral membrane protein
MTQHNAPAGWYPDPTGRHESRYFDGQWTQHVSTRGVRSTDPSTARTRPSAPADLQNPPSASRRRRRRVLVVILVALILVVLLLVFLTRCGTTAQQDSLVGDWDVTYGAPSVVTIAKTANGSYTMKAKTPVTVVRSSCKLPPGTLIATFTRRSDRRLTGRHGLWNTASCAFAQWAPVTLTQASNNRITEAIQSAGETHKLVRHR